jgi:hypothetical protein
VNADAGPQLQQPGCVDIPTGTREFILRLMGISVSEFPTLGFEPGINTEAQPPIIFFMILPQVM